jgi:hypothetical protein
MSFDVNFKTRLTASRIRSMERLLDKIKHDEEKDRRILLSECPYCFYGVFMAGQAFTDFSCKICDKAERHFNTNIPIICNECATKYNLCIQCGCDMNYDINRELNF